MGKLFKIVTKKCPICGREYFLQLVSDGKVLYRNNYVGMLSECPFDRVILDYNIHEFLIGGEEFIIDVTKKCASCKFEIDLYDAIIGDHKLLKKEGAYEVEKKCPICSGRLYVSHHITVK